MEYIIFKEHFVVLQTQMLFVDAFLQNNRLDHVTQLMGYHPNYLEMFLRTQQYLLRGDGPLPFHYRHYIAIMVSQHEFWFSSENHTLCNNGGKKDDSENFPFKKNDVLYTNSSVNIDFFFLSLGALTSWLQCFMIGSCRLPVGISVRISSTFTSRSLSFKEGTKTGSKDQPSSLQNSESSTKSTKSWHIDRGCLINHTLR